MSDTFPSQFQNLSNDELINLALECLGEEQEALRHALLQEHFLRIKDDPKTIIAPAVDLDLLRLKVNEIFYNKNSES